MKDKTNKILSRTLITYLVVLCIIVVMKLNGLDYFGLDVDNKIIVGIDKTVKSLHLELLWYGITLYIYQFVILSITCVDNSEKMFKYNIVILPISVIFQILKSYTGFNGMFIITDLLWLLIAMILYNKLVKKSNLERYNISNYFIYTLLNIIFQAESIFIRNVNVIYDYDNFIMSVICNFDYILLSIISYKLFFNIGGKSLWDGVVFSFLHLQALLKDLLIKLQKIFVNKKKKSKVERVSNMIYFPLYLLWNIFTLAVVIFIAFLNDTPIECMIILISFWINKTAFGKPFHMKTALSCFIVSNISYYCLNRITFSVGISLLISIVLGILLNYITSFFVNNQKKKNKLYRGMPKDKFDMVMFDVLNMSSVEYEICKMFYVDNFSEIKIATKLNYSVSMIQKKRYKILNILKELN